MVLDGLQHPIVQAPMGGGASTPALAAAVAEAGGLGFLAAGYKTPDAVRADIEALRALTDRPFGVNLFAPPAVAADDVGPFAARLAAEAERYGAPVGEPRHDDDGWDAKLALMAELEVPVVSFTFGCPSRDVLEGLGETWVTVTTPAEARQAAEAGADALVVQGVEAGGHRGTFDDAAPGEIGLLALLQLIDVDLPLVATGGIATGRGVAAVLAAGATAAQLGTAFMLCDEAATAPAHREAIASGGDTALTRAFTGRSARGIANRWMREHEAEAPQRLPGRAPPDGEDPRRRARAGRCGRLPPVGRPGARARLDRAGRRARPAARGRGARRPARVLAAAGGGGRGAKARPMSEAHTEPHVSGQELREALAQHGRTRPNPLMATSEPEAPAWEWTTDEQAELEQLRESTAELQNEIDRLRGVAADGRAREKELRDALKLLASSRAWQRRTVMAELAGRGLI